jgi:hypothetical protein
MNKPVKKEHESHYDYNECQDWIESKYGYKVRDYLGKFTYYKNGSPKGFNENIKYLDFWHWITDNFDIHNGSYFLFSKDDLNNYRKSEPEWVKRIYNDFLTEFADENGEIEFYVWW